MLPIVDVEINQLMETVPIQSREALDRRYVHGGTSDQIGPEPGVPATTVRSRLRLAVNWLKNASRRDHMKGAMT